MPQGCANVLRSSAFCHPLAVLQHDLTLRLPPLKTDEVSLAQQNADDVAHCAIFVADPVSTNALGPLTHPVPVRNA